MAVGFAPSFALADWTAFVPRPFENQVFLDVFTSFERDDNRSGTRATRWTDTFVKEKLTLYSIGYSYHPRFLQYQFSLAGTGKHEDYDSTSTQPVGWRHGSGLEYYAKLLFLPEHPYNLDVYVSRYEPLFKEQAATQHDSVITNHGTSLRYRKKPYFLNANYDNSSVESAESSSEVTSLSLAGEYFKRYRGEKQLSFSGAVNPSWYSNSLGIEGNSLESLLENVIDLRRVRLTSSATKNSFDQESPSSGKFKSDRFGWQERLSAYLPWNFRTDLAYRRQENEGTIHDVGAAPSRTLSDKGNDIQLRIAHALYQSLDTSYTFLRASRTSSGGATTGLSHAVGLSYTKSIPRGRITAGMNASRGETDNRGQADILDEPHSATLVPGSFTLSQQNVQLESIRVFFRCPVSPFALVRLDDFFAVPVLNTFEIHVTALPSTSDCPFDFVPGETYDLFASYSLLGGEFGLQTDTLSGNTSLDLFNNLLTPYFSYVTVKSEVSSGVFLGIPVDATTYTTGLVVHRGPLRVRGEYQDLQWDVSPSQTWRAEVQYAAPLNPTTSAYATASYVNRHHSLGTSLYYTAAFTEETESASGLVQKQFFSRNMSLSVGGSYSRTQGLVESNAYGLNASWAWRIGKSDLTVGGSAYAADATGTRTISTRRDHELFYVKLRRRLF